MSTDTLLVDALHRAPRRYRMPPLPRSAEAAAVAGPETALAFAIESARLAREARSEPAGELPDLFTGALAALIRQALAAEAGDPAFQALVLRAREPLVDEYVRLDATAAADARAVRATVNAIAHPGKTRSLPGGAARDALLLLHELAGQAAWAPLQQGLAGHLPPHDPVTARLARLVRLAALREAPAVQQYLDLCARRGPLAGTDAATAQGRVSARLGEAAEQATVQAFRRIADLLDQGAGRHAVVRSLKTPPGFPGAVAKAKDEWDVAIVRTRHDNGRTIVLLAEVKAAPAAATPDFSRLHRGLQRLAQADAGATYTFPSADGDVPVDGASLRALQPAGRDLPPHVIYCSCAPAEAQPPVLGAATRAVLLAEPASIAFARDIVREASPPHHALEPVWEALQAEPRLRSALHQFDTARRARAAMLHPDDLASAVALRLHPPTPT